MMEGSQEVPRGAATASVLSLESPGLPEMGRHNTLYHGNRSVDWSVHHGPGANGTHCRHGHRPTAVRRGRCRVTVVETRTNQSVTVKANERGDYVVTPLNPGIYRVTVASQGFQRAVVNVVEVQVGQSARVDVELKIGEMSSTIEVVSTAPLLDSESGTLGHVVTNTQIVDLPLNGRSFYELARLMPGAALLPGGGNLLRIRANYISGTAISGVRGSQTTFLMDGVDVTDHHQGGDRKSTRLNSSHATLYRMPS